MRVLIGEWRKPTMKFVTVMRGIITKQATDGAQVDVGVDASGQRIRLTAAPVMGGKGLQLATHRGGSVEAVRTLSVEEAEELLAALGAMLDGE